jgi:hypothetical protein
VGVFVGVGVGVGLGVICEGLVTSHDIV